MSLISCAKEALEKGRITKEQADKLLEQADVPEDQIIKGALEEVALKKRQTALQAIKFDEALKNARSHKKGLSAGVMSLIVRDITGNARYSNIDAMSRGIFGDYQRELADMLMKYRTKMAGLTQDKEGARNMVRELFEEVTGDSNASLFAKAWTSVADRARIRFNRAGGNIKSKKEWRLPQHHDPLMVQRAGFEKWYSDLKEMIEPLRSKSGKELTEKEAREVLEDSFNAIRTGGASRIEPGVKGGKKRGNAHQESRVLDFKDANSWLKYQDEYGSKDIFTMMQDHLRKMADETALLEVLGPNPSDAYEHLLALQAKEGSGAFSRQFQQAVFREQTGIGSIENIGRVASGLGAVRNLMGAAKLGAAWISAWSDLFFVAQTAKFNDLPALKIFKRMAKNLVGSEENRKNAVRLGLIAEAALSRSIGANRYTEVFAKGITAKMNDFVMRASLLAPWTEAARTAFGMEFTSHFAAQVGKQFDDLSKPLQNALKRGGISADEWALIAKATPTDIDGVKFLATEAIQSLNISKAQKDNLSAKYMGMILQESDIAVPTPDSRVRAIVGFKTQKGTFIGEAVRTGIMFKSFPATLVTTHMYRGAMQQGMDRLSYLGGMFVGTSVLGAIALQAKDISKGKNPRDMSDPKFMAAAAVQGAAMGIMGDFLFSDQNRFGGGAVSSMGGPALGLVDDVFKLTLGNIQQAAKGEDTNLAGESIKFVGNYLPGGNLWYTRLAFERAVIDQLALAADPKMARKFSRKVRKQKRDYGSDFWWKPGKLTPESAPKLEKAVGK